MRARLRRRCALDAVSAARRGLGAPTRGLLHPVALHLALQVRVLLLQEAHLVLNLILLLGELPLQRRDPFVHVPADLLLHGPVAHRALIPGRGRRRFRLRLVLRRRLLLERLRQRAPRALGGGRGHDRLPVLVLLALQLDLPPDLFQFPALLLQLLPLLLALAVQLELSPPLPLLLLGLQARLLALPLLLACPVLRLEPGALLLQALPVELELRPLLALALLLALPPLLLERPLLALPLLLLLPPLLLEALPLLLALALRLPPLLGIPGALPRHVEPRADAPVQECGAPENRGQALAAPQARRPPERVLQPDGVEGAAEPPADREAAIADPLPRVPEAHREARGHHGNLADRPRRPLLVHARNEPRDVEAELDRTDGPDPALPDDPAHNLREGLRLGPRAAGAHVLQGPELPGLEEEAGHAQDPLLPRHLVGEHQRLDEGAHAVALEVFRQEVLEARGDLFERATVRVAAVHQLHELDGAALNDLVEHELLLEDARLLFLIRLEAPDVVQVAGAERAEEGLEVLHVLLADGPEERLPLVLLAQRPHEGEPRLAQELLALGEEPVVVLVQPALRAILNAARIVPDDEALVHRWPGAAPPLVRHLQLLQDVLPLRVLRRLLHSLHAEPLVAGGVEALGELLAVVVEAVEDLGDAVDDGLRVREGQRAPGQALALVEALLRDEDVLDEVLLQPLVRQVDAELLEGVPLEPLEAVDVQDADVAQLAPAAVRRGRRPRALGPQLAEGVVDGLDGALEEPLVEGLDEAVQGLAELRLAPRHLVEGVPARDRDLLALQRGAEAVRVHAEQPRGPLDALVVDLHGSGVVLLPVRRPRRGLLVLGDVPEVHEPGQDLEDRVDGLAVVAHGPQRVAEPPEVFGVPALALWRREAAEHQAVLAVPLKLELRELLVAEAGKHLVETVVCPLALAVDHDAGALQEVRGDVRVHEGARLVEVHPVELPEARGVRVPHRGGVSEGLQDRLRLEHARLDAVGQLRGGARGIRQVVHDDLGRLCLPGPALA
mmetsp:Transcript_94185/g.266549  ORF Transcript_94185/g.266549 Transcript_94185/m.266549 type:complete len:1014 (+) Transcript_94185:1095-4136(+)